MISTGVGYFVYFSVSPYVFHLIILTLLVFEPSSFSSEYFYPVTQTDD
jgi:hypothetical protein